MNNFDAITAQDKPTLVDVFATWCQPCKMMHPVIEEVKTRVGDKVTVLKVDIDRSPTLAARHNIRAVPTLLIFKSGEVVWRATGVHAADDIVRALEAHY